MATRLFPPGSDDVIYVVDLSSYVLRAYHAVAPLTNPSGEPTGAVHGMVNMLERMLRERSPRLMAVALDAGRETFRKQIYPEYKAHRPPAPDDLRSQLQRAEQIVLGYHAAIYKQEGVEADDLIATVVRRAREQQLKVVILAADKDLMQLVGDDVMLWDTMRDRVIGAPEVEERFGVRVDQLQDLLALMGDTSDNIPGVPSVGPKTAMELLKAYGSLKGIYENLDKISKKGLLQKLTEHREQAFLSQQLVALKDDCPIDASREALTYRGRDVEKLKALYAELGPELRAPGPGRERAPRNDPNWLAARRSRGACASDRTSAAQRAGQYLGRLRHAAHAARARGVRGRLASRRRSGPRDRAHRREPDARRADRLRAVRQEQPRPLRAARASLRRRAE